VSDGETAAQPKPTPAVGDRFGCMRIIEILPSHERYGVLARIQCSCGAIASQPRRLAVLRDRPPKYCAKCAAKFRRWF
jgi:hypothetical protein